MLNDDYKEMLQCLSEERVEYLLVGAYALAVHGFPRATKDIDVYVGATADNASRLMRALARFGASLTEVSEADFASEGAIFQIGNTPRRIDILTRIDGIEVPTISVEDLIANKRASGGPQDIADVLKLESLPRP
ncbi:MAG: DUF6036 family nucleotidyltransferase [Steroidobacteraceae bacterium]